MEFSRQESWSGLPFPSPSPYLSKDYYNPSLIYYLINSFIYLVVLDHCQMKEKNKKKNSLIKARKRKIKRTCHQKLPLNF